MNWLLDSMLNSLNVLCIRDSVVCSKFEVDGKRRVEGPTGGMSACVWHV